VYASLAALLIVITVLLIIISVFESRNIGFQEMKKIADNKAQEQLSITNAYISNGNVVSVLIENEGTIELKIRALYIKSQTTEFATDPSVNIPPASSKNITLTSPIPFTPGSYLVAATERGTLSKEYYILSWEKTIYNYDTENLTIGPLRLRFESFEYSLNYDNRPNTWGPWQPGWTPPLNVYISWRIRVTNVGEDRIILNNYTALSLCRVAEPKSEIVWYINTSKAGNTEELLSMETTNIFFHLSKPAGNKNSDFNAITAGNGVSTMVFLTFFGQITLPGGQTRSYGQTIPFEAVIPGG